MTSPGGGTVGNAAGAVRSGIAGKCLDVNASATANGTRVQLWSCNNSGAQQWTSSSDGTLKALGKCLDATAGGLDNGTKVQLFQCNNTGAQVWQPFRGGYLNLQSGRCLDDPAASAADGTQFQLYDCNSTSAQLWSKAGA